MYKHAFLNTLLLLHSPFMLSVVKIVLKGEVRGHALNSHENYIVDHGKIMELCFLISVGTLQTGVVYVLLHVEVTPDIDLGLNEIEGITYFWLQ